MNRPKQHNKLSFFCPKGKKKKSFGRRPKPSAGARSTPALRAVSSSNNNGSLLSNGKKQRCVQVQLMEKVTAAKVDRSRYSPRERIRKVPAIESALSSAPGPAPLPAPVPPAIPVHTQCTHFCTCTTCTYWRASQSDYFINLDTKNSPFSPQLIVVWPLF